MTWSKRGSSRVKRFPFVLLLATSVSVESVTSKDSTSTPRVAGVSSL